MSSEIELLQKPLFSASKASASAKVSPMVKFGCQNGVRISWRNRPKLDFGPHLVPQGPKVMLKGPKLSQNVKKVTQNHQKIVTKFDPQWPQSM